MMHTGTRGRRYFATSELRATIRRQGRMLTWVADQVGVTKGHFAHVLNGQRTVSDDDARLITTMLGADFSALWNVSDGARTAPDRTETAA